jgi:hypothetical protein
MNATTATAAMLVQMHVLSRQLPLNSAPLVIAEIQLGSPDIAIVINTDDEGKAVASDPGVPVRVSSLRAFHQD